MKIVRNPLLGVLAAFLTTAAIPAHAGLFITEVHSAGSGNGTYAADWFELTNTGASAVNITGWKMDDNSNSFASAVSFRGVSSIAAGQSVVFFEGNTSGSTDAAITSAFNAAWGTSFVFGTTIGAYGGSGVGLSTSGDAVNVFNASGTLQARVDLGVATNGATFDNAVMLNNVTLSQFSAVGVNGAFLSANAQEIGSPAAIANPVPEPESYALLLAGLGLIGVVARRRRH